MPILVVASLGFYAWWDWRNLFILGPSLAVHFAVGHWLTGSLGNRPGAVRRVVVTHGLVFNLGLLGWFKYLDFTIHTLNVVAEPLSA